MAKPGQALSPDEMREVQAYHNAGISLPDKFDSIVIDNTDHRGVVYRHATADEQRAAEDAAKASADATAESERLMAKVRAEAAKRSTPGVPPMPAAPEKPSA
jgi:hypothetical protein